MRSYEEIVRLVADFLNKEKIPYVMVGAIAVAFYGSPRTSQDIDIFAVLENKIGKFVNFLRKNNFDVNKQDIKDALKEKAHFNVFDNLSQFRLDIKGIYNELDRETLNNRRKIRFKDTCIYVNAPEDLIAHKLDFGSEKDLNDVRSILIRQKKLDMSYLKTKAKKMNNYKKLINILKEIKQRRLK